MSLIAMGWKAGELLVLSTQCGLELATIVGRRKEPDPRHWLGPAKTSKVVKSLEAAMEFAGN